MTRPRPIVAPFAVALIAIFVQSWRPASAGPPRAITFADNVAPLVFDRCGGCHRPGGPAPFSLLTYAAVKQRATQIADVTTRRFMPAWKTEPGYGDFVGQRPLGDEEIALIQRWVDAGAPEGDPSRLPPLPRWTEGWQLGQPDLILTLPEPFTLTAQGTDAFRIFVIPIPADAPRYVRGLEFRPGNAQVVHHANIRIDRTPASRQLDATDPAPGYDGLIARSAVYPDGHFFGWTPGQMPALLPKGLAWRLDPGTDLVLQVHMQPSGRPENVQPSVGLFFGGDPPERAPSMLRLGRQNIDIAAGDKRYIVTDSYKLPVDVEVQAVQPHAHYRAREIRGLATLPDGTTKWLVYIKDWDFRWQHVYRYRAPFALPRGTTLSMEFVYDNSPDNPRNPQRPLRRVRWGQRSFDEMGDLWIQVLTRDQRDLATLNRDFQPKLIAEDITGYEMMIAAEPGDPALHDDVALLYLDLGRPAEAVRHFEASLGLKPQSAVAHFNLGTALSLARRWEEAVAAYHRALQLDPNYANAHNNLGGADAIRHFREALRLKPQWAPALAELGVKGSKDSY